MMSMYNPYYPAAQLFRPHLNPAQQGAHPALKAFTQSNNNSTPTYISSNASLNDTGSSRSDNSSDSPPHSTHHHHLGLSFLFLKTGEFFRETKQPNKAHPSVLKNKLSLSRQMMFYLSRFFSAKRGKPTQPRVNCLTPPTFFRNFLTRPT